MATGTKVPTGFDVPTPSPRTKHRKTSTGRAHAHVAKSKWTKPSTRKPDASLAPLSYGRGPYEIPVENYVWRFWAIRGDESKRVKVGEFDSVSWDDSSAVLTGSLTFRTPEWADRLGIKSGHQIRCEANDGSGFEPLWTMRVDQPNSDLASRSRTVNLVSDLNRLALSTDDFTYAKGKRKKGGWRADLVIRDVCARYNIPVASCPRMKALIKHWHLVDQAPLDVIHSALIREKNVTGRKYAVSLDWQGRLHVSSFRRPRHLWQVGPQLLAATGSETANERFATALTVRTDTTSETTDKKGNRKVRHHPMKVVVPTPKGIKLYGLIHRNVYSPDANSQAELRHEGKLFLAAVAKPVRQFSVTLPGMPHLRRLDAMRVLLREHAVNQIVYVSEVRHNVSSSGYTTEAVLNFEDPFLDDKRTTILDKLSDTAVARQRRDPTPKKPKNKPKSSKTQQAHKPKPKSVTGFDVVTPTTSRDAVNHR